MSSSVESAVLEAAVIRSSKFLRSKAMYGPMKGSNTPDSMPMIGGRQPSTSSFTPSPSALSVANSDFGTSRASAGSRWSSLAAFAYLRLIPSALFGSIIFPSASSSTSRARRLSFSIPSNREWASFSKARHLWTAYGNTALMNPVGSGGEFSWVRCGTLVCGS